MEEIEYVEQFEKYWLRYPKNTIMVYPINPGEAFVSFYCEAGSLQVACSVYIGKDGSLCEQLGIIEPAKRIVLDRYVFSGVSRKLDGFLLNLAEMQESMKKSSDCVAFCSARLEKLLENILKHPESFARKLRHIPDMFSNSVSTVSGGLPSLGKGSR